MRACPSATRITPVRRSSSRRRRRARSETLRARVADAVVDGRRALRERIERRYGDEVDAEAVAAAVVALLPGYLHAKVIVGGMDAERYRRGLDGLAALLR